MTTALADATSQISIRGVEQCAVGATPCKMKHDMVLVEIEVEASMGNARGQAGKNKTVDAHSNGQTLSKVRQATVS